MTKLELTKIGQLKSNDEVVIHQPILPLVNLASPATERNAGIARRILVPLTAISTTIPALFLMVNPAIALDLASLMAITIIPSAVAAVTVATALTEDAAKKVREKNEKDAKILKENLLLVPENLYLINKNIFSELSTAYLASEEMLESINGNVDSDQLAAVLNDVFRYTNRASAAVVNEEDFMRASQEMQTMTKKCFRDYGFPDIDVGLRKAQLYPPISQITLIACCCKALMNDKNLLPNVDRAEFGRKYEDLLKLFEEDFTKKFGNAEPAQDLLRHSRNYIKHKDLQKNVDASVNLPSASQLRNRGLEENAQHTV